MLDISAHVKAESLNTGSHTFVYVSKCSASVQIPHIQTVLTKRIEVAALGHKMWQFSNRFSVAKLHVTYISLYWS